VNWDAIGAIGEVVGGIAVVATLFYLAVQIRQNTQMSRASMTKDLMLASRAAIMDNASNDRLAGIWAEIRDDFDDPDAARRYSFYQSYFRLYELQFNLSKQGLMDETISTSYELVVRMFTQTKHFDQYWSVARSQFHEDFAAYVDFQ
jgi:hypothetical protein